MIDFCLGLEVLGKCSAYINGEYSFFGVGIYLSILGLFFAGFQLIQPIHKIRLRYRSKNVSIIRNILMGNILIVLFATILPYIPGEPLAILGYPVAREMIGLLITITCGVILFLSATMSLRKINHKKFFNLLLNTSVSEDKLIEAMIDDLPYYLDSLVYFEEKHEGYTESIITVLGNKTYLNHIVKNARALQEIIISYSEVIKNNGELKEFHRDFLKLIIKESLSQEDSIIGQELAGILNNGINNTRGIITDMLISNYRLLNQVNVFYAVLGDIEVRIGGYTATYAKNFSILWKHILNFYILHLEEYADEYQLIDSGFTRLGGLLEQYYDKIWLEGASRSNTLFFTLQTKDIFLHTHIQDFNQLHLENIAGRDSYDPLHSKMNLLDILAFGVCSCIDGMCSYEVRNNPEIDTRMSLMHILGYNESGDANKAIIMRVQKWLLQEIEESTKGYKAWIGKAFWHMYGHHVYNLTGEKTDFYKAMVKAYGNGLDRLGKGLVYGYEEQHLQYPHYKEYTERKAKDIIKSLLPQNMRFDVEQGRLYYYYLNNSSYHYLKISDMKAGNIIIGTVEQEI